MPRGRPKTTAHPMKVSPNEFAKNNLIGTRKATRSLATVLSDSENPAHDAHAVSATIATWNQDTCILVVSGLTPGHFDRWLPENSDRDDRSRSVSEAHSQYGPGSPSVRQTNSNGKRSAASYESDWTETEVEDWVPQKARGFYRPDPRREIVKRWVPKSESSRHNKSIRKRVSSVTSSGSLPKSERQSRSRNSAREGLPSPADDEVPTIEGEPSDAHLQIPTITRDDASEVEPREEKKAPPPEVIDEGELSDSAFPEPFEEHLPDPDRANCEDEADFIYKKRFAPMTDPQKFIEALTKLPAANRDSVVLYQLALNTQKALKSWQDEYLFLELRTAPAANPPKKPVTGGRVPVDPQVFEDQKEADLYGYEYDPKKLPGQQDPFRQRKTGPGRNKGRELRDRREAVSRRRDAGAEATEGEGTGTEGYAMRRRTKAVQKYDGEPKPPTARSQGVKRVLSQGTPEFDAPPPKKRGRPSAADKAAMKNQAAMQSRIRQLREESAAVTTSSEGDAKSPEPTKRRGRPPGSKNTQPRSDAGVKKGPRKSKIGILGLDGITRSSDGLNSRSTPAPAPLPTTSVEAEINGKPASTELEAPRSVQNEISPVKKTWKRSRRSADNNSSGESGGALKQHEPSTNQINQNIDSTNASHDGQIQGRDAHATEVRRPTEEPERKTLRGVYHYPPSGPPAGSGYWEAQNQIQRAQLLQRNEQHYHQQVQQQQNSQPGWSLASQRSGPHPFNQPPPSQFQTHSRSGSFAASPTQRNPGSYPPSPTQGSRPYAPSPKQQAQGGPLATSPTNQPIQHTFGPVPPGQTVPSLGPQPSFTFLPPNHSQPPAPPPLIQAQHDAPLKRIHGYVSDPNAAAQPSGLYQTIMRPGPSEPAQSLNQSGSVPQSESSGGGKKQPTSPGGGFSSFTVQVQQPRPTIPGTSSWRPSSRLPARSPAAAPGRVLAPIASSGTITGAQVQDMHLANVQPPQRRRLEDVMAEQQETHKDRDRGQQQSRPLQPYPPTLPSNGPVPYRPEYGLPSSRLLQKQLAPAPNGPPHFQQASHLPTQQQGPQLQSQQQGGPTSQFQNQGPLPPQFQQGPTSQLQSPGQGSLQQHQGAPPQQHVQHQGPPRHQQHQNPPQHPPPFLPPPLPLQQQQGSPQQRQQQHQQIPGLKFPHMFHPPFDPEGPPQTQNPPQGRSRQNSKSQMPPQPYQFQAQGQGQQIMPQSSSHHHQQQPQQQQQNGHHRHPPQGNVSPAFSQAQASQGPRPSIAPAPIANGPERGAERNQARQDVPPPPEPESAPGPAPPPAGQMRFVEMHGDGRRGVGK
ncbi:hypothetical protein FKW77_009964 [Venturia effusa]|uniref:Uncharacterized protein n=1 Tax=Venturia effusa TaxID=50376 RepID=A0A517L4A0_9PEZI|nr:hypothetical protein FKW77_009964 [Venturia effusa]